MKVNFEYSNQINDGKAIYRKNENSFDFISNEKGDISILIKYLQISVKASNNNLISVWGLHPYHLWKTTNLNIPDFSMGIVRCLDNYESGISYRDDEYENWNTYYDIHSGWICIGNKDFIDEAIMFATNTGVVIRENEIISIWIKPEVV